jgi:hypothetical protein
MSLVQKNLATRNVSCGASEVGPPDPLRSKRTQGLFELNLDSPTQIGTRRLPSQLPMHDEC